MRREATITIDTDGRDKGKVFKLTELFSEQGEDWAIRLLLALGKSGVEVPETMFTMGMMGVAAMGIQSMMKLPWEMAKPLMVEMMQCIRIAPDLRNPNVIRQLIPDDIEEVATRIFLRDEVIRLHVGFSVIEFISNLTKMQEALVDQATERMFGSGLDTKTSQPQSDESSLLN